MARRKEDNDGAIDLTPMLDVVFIMLIFFIVTASFVKEAGIQIIKPAGVTSDPRNAKILIAISADDKVWIDKSPVDKRSVRLHIERLRSETRKGALYCKPILGQLLKWLRTFWTWRAKRVPQMLLCRQSGSRE